MSSFFLLATCALLLQCGLCSEFLGQIRQTQEVNESDTFRNDILRNAEKTILEHNSRKDKTFLMGMTKFAQYTQEEFLTQLTGGCIYQGGEPLKEIRFDSMMGAPDSVDWRVSEIAKNVKDQGNNPTGAVFAAIGAIEAAMNIKNRGVSLSLSEQQIIDCSAAVKTCTYGTLEHSLKYATTNPMIKESDYSYQGEKKTCKADLTQGLIELKDLFMVQKSEEQLMEAIARQPIPFCFDARHLQYYVKGTIPAQNCSNSEVNFCSLLVGYTKNEWIAKASFGEEWGEKGYFRLEKGGNTCGMMNYIYFPII